MSQKYTHNTNLAFFTTTPIIPVLCPQDILVASSLSFGHTREDTERKIPGWARENEFTEDGPTLQAPEIVFAPPHDTLTTQKPPLRKGTVEDIPPPRPTLPPVVKTSGLELKEHMEYLSSTPVPNKRTTLKTSKIDLLGDYSARSKNYEGYLKGLLMGNFEEPSRSTEMIEPSGDHLRYGGLAPSGYLPRQREPYPYQNMAAPLPYLITPKLSRIPPPQQRAEFDRENLLGNRMNNLRNIDGRGNSHNSGLNIRNYNKYERPSVEKYPEINKTPSKFKPERDESGEPELSALTLTQLSSKLSLTTPIPDRDTRTEESREYTVFDMADAVTITVIPPGVEEEDIKEDERHYIPYSQPAPSRVRGPVSRIGVTSDSRDPDSSLLLVENESRDPDMVSLVEGYKTMRPDNIESDQSPAPASNSEHKLMVDMSLVQESLRNKRNVSVDDLLFLYNITFLTDSKEILSSIGNRELTDHNIAISPDTEQLWREDYDETFDYDSIPLPDYQALDSEDKFNNALNEFLEDYEDYSSEKTRLKHQGSSQDIENVEDLLTKIIGDSSVPEDLFEDHREPGEAEWEGGHRVNHRHKGAFCQKI